MTESRSDEASDATPSEVEIGGPAFAALRPRARTIFLAYIKLKNPNVTAAADAVGFSHNNAWELFRSDPMKAAILEWQTAIHHDTRNGLKVATQKAVEALVDCLDSTDPDVKIKASIAILDRGGFAPKQVVEMVAEVKHGKLSDLSDEELEALTKADEAPEPAPG